MALYLAFPDGMVAVEARELSAAKATLFAAQEGRLPHPQFGLKVYGIIKESDTANVVAFFTTLVKLDVELQYLNFLDKQRELSLAACTAITEYIARTKTLEYVMLTLNKDVAWTASVIAEIKESIADRDPAERSQLGLGAQRGAPQHQQLPHGPGHINVGSA